MTKIYGNLYDAAGRCIHYHQSRDIVAMKCAWCNRFYACYLCHDGEQDHLFRPLVVDDPNQQATVLCGNCKTEQTYEDYVQLGYCRSCQQSFNPACARHHDHYFCLKHE